MIKSNLKEEQPELSDDYLLPNDLMSIIFSYAYSYGSIYTMLQSITPELQKKMQRLLLLLNKMKSINDQMLQNDLFNFIQENQLISNHEVMKKIRLFCKKNRHTAWGEIKEINNEKTAENYCLYALTIPNITELNFNLLKTAKQTVQYKADQGTINALTVIEVLLNKQNTREDVERCLVKLLCDPQRNYYINISGGDCSDLRLIKKNNDQDTLIGINLSAAYAIGTNFTHSTMIKVNLSKADLRGAKFYYTDISEGNMSDCKCRGARFFQIRFEYIVIEGSLHLHQSTVEECQFIPDAKNIVMTQEQVDKNILNDHMQKREGMTSQALPRLPILFKQPSQHDSSTIELRVLQVRKLAIHKPIW